MLAGNLLNSEIWKPDFLDGIDGKYNGHHV